MTLAREPQRQLWCARCPTCRMVVAVSESVGDLAGLGDEGYIVERAGEWSFRRTFGSCFCRTRPREGQMDLFATGRP